MITKVLCRRIVHPVSFLEALIDIVRIGIGITIIDAPHRRVNFVFLLGWMFCLTMHPCIFHAIMSGLFFTGVFFVPSQTALDAKKEEQKALES